MTDSEHNQYAKIEPNNLSKIKESVYDVPGNVPNDSKTSSARNQVRLRILQLKTWYQKNSTKKLLGTILILLVAINVIIFCLMIISLTYSQQNNCLLTEYTAELTQKSIQISIAIDQTKGIFEITSNNISNLLRIPKSCQDVRTRFPSSTSGYYYINNEEVYCEMGELCGVDGGWSRLAYLDITDNNTVNCPSGLRYYSLDGVKACGRPVSNGGSCGSVIFPSHGISYSEVCGRVMGYQYGSPDGLDGPSNIHVDSYYVNGISITSGNPRTHVWTLMGEIHQTSALCPCSSQYTGPSIPSFIGDNYFCESGNPYNYWSPTLYASDPLWDGKGCSSYESECCSGPPWFHKTIDTTTDYLEMRICSDQDTYNEDTPVSVYEIYVK